MCASESDSDSASTGARASIKGMDMCQCEDGRTTTCVESTDGVQCGYPGSTVCGLNKKSATLCKHHKAGETKRNRGDIITNICYGSLSEAAMAAANIIKCHMFQKDDSILRENKDRLKEEGYILQDDGYRSLKKREPDEDDYILQPYDFEYGVSIYERKGINGSPSTFYLAETKQGTEYEVILDYNVKHHKYHLIATVHSHPATGIYEHSDGDYVVSCGGKVYGNKLSLFPKDEPPHISFLLGVDWSRAWSINRSYKNGEIVTYGDKRWIANRAERGSVPSEADGMWKEVKGYKGEKRDDKYNEGDVVFDHNAPYRFRKMTTAKGHVNGKLAAIPYEGHGAWTLIRFTPPSDRKVAKMLAIVLSFLSPSFSIDDGFPSSSWGYPKGWITFWNALPRQYCTSPKIPLINQTDSYYMDTIFDNDKTTPDCNCSRKTNDRNDPILADAFRRTIQTNVAVAHWVALQKKYPKKFVIPKFSSWAKHWYDFQKQHRRDYSSIYLDDSNWVAIAAAMNADISCCNCYYKGKKDVEDAIENWRGLSGDAYDLQKESIHKIIRDFGGTLEQRDIIEDCCSPKGRGEEWKNILLK